MLFRNNPVQPPGGRWVYLIPRPRLGQPSGYRGCVQQVPALREQRPELRTVHSSVQVPACNGLQLPFDRENNCGNDIIYIVFVLSLKAQQTTRGKVVSEVSVTLEILNLEDYMAGSNPGNPGGWNLVVGTGVSCHTLVLNSQQST